MGLGRGGRRDSVLAHRALQDVCGGDRKTAAKGEINVLDPGGFGAVTITKSISIISDIPQGGILASLTTGLIVNAAADGIVVLRGLNINGFGNGINGVRFLAGAELHVEDCEIYGFAQEGIRVAASTAAKVFIKDTIVRNNVGAAAGGILLSRTGVDPSRPPSSACARSATATVSAWRTRRAPPSSAARRRATARTATSPRAPRS